MKANIEKRLEALEQASQSTKEPMETIRVVVSPADRQITAAFRRGEGGQLVPVSDDELAEIRRDNQP